MFPERLLNTSRRYLYSDSLVIIWFLYFLMIQCPFGRIVYIFNYKNTVILNQLEVLVTEINAKALQLDDMPPHVISAALSTYKLSL